MQHAPTHTVAAPSPDAPALLPAAPTPLQAAFALVEAIPSPAPTAPAGVPVPAQAPVDSTVLTPAPAVANAAHAAVDTHAPEQVEIRGAVAPSCVSRIPPSKCSTQIAGQAALNLASSLSLSKAATTPLEPELHC